MKNIQIKIVLFLSLLLISSCSKELEYGTNFEFKINNIDNNSVVLFSEKTFALELTTFFNNSDSKTFSFSYDCQDVDIIDNNTTLLKNQKYPVTFNADNLLPLKLKGTAQGEFVLKITLTDESGLSKEKQVLVKVVEDLNFSFVANNMQPLYEDVITTTFTFSLALQNTGTGADTYSIKALPSSPGTVLINSALAVPNELISTVPGNINVSFTPSTLGNQTLTLVAVNSQNIEQEVTFNLKVNPKIFTVVSSGTLTTKQTQLKDFSFVTNNTISTWQYQVKFESNTQAVFKSSTGSVIPTNTYVNLPMNTSNFTYKYQSDAIGSDIITISVKDQFDQVVTTSINVTVESRPTIAAVEAKVTNNGAYLLGAFYKINGVQGYGAGSAIQEYEFKILNYKTNLYDTYTTVQNTAMYPQDCLYGFYFSTTYGTCSGVSIVPHTQITNEDRNINYYWNQPYTVRVKDADGIWSTTVTGTMTY